MAFFNVDSRFIKILGTEKFNNNEIKNEPSLVKSWYPTISSENDKHFKFLWKDVWGGTINYFSNVGFDTGIIALNYLNSLDMTSDNLANFNSLEKNSIDLYSSFKSIYLQDRENKLKNSTSNDDDWGNLDN